MSYVLLGGGSVDSETSNFVFDSLVETNEKYKTTVTKHAVESGYNVADHKFRKNTVLTLKGIVQNGAMMNSTGNTNDNNVVTQGGDDRMNQARTKLLELYESDDTFTLVMKYESFSECVITSLDFPRNANTANILTANIVIEQLRVVTSATVTITSADDSISDDSQGTTSSGSGGKKSVSTDEDDEDREWSVVKTIKGLSD